MFTKKFLILSFSLVMLCSCASSKKILYLQDAVATQENSVKYENTLQPDDNLMITVSADEPELASEFNLIFVNARSTDLRALNINEALYTYLIDQKGEIDFPILGKIKMAGLTRIDAENKIKELLRSHIVNPGVTVRVLNFEVSVMGEVVRPGTQRVVGDRLTIFEAISMAGDLTIYGQRKNIMLIREKDGVRTITELDITDTSIINSPYYYLAHNDVIYVKPNKTKVNSSVVGPNLTIGISAVSLLITIITLATK